MLERIILKLVAFGYDRAELEQMTMLELSHLLINEQNIAAAAHAEYEWKVTRLGKVYYAQKYNKAA
jgi:hypothetical protein